MTWTGRLASLNALSSKVESLLTEFPLAIKLELSGKQLNSSFLNFTLNKYRYHAHSEVQRADGLYGGLIVHNPVFPAENNSHDYDSELLFMVGDWYHWPATKVLEHFMRPTSAGVEVQAIVISTMM